MTLRRAEVLPVLRVLCFCARLFHVRFLHQIQTKIEKKFRTNLGPFTAACPAASSLARYKVV